MADEGSAWAENEGPVRAQPGSRSYWEPPTREETGGMARAFPAPSLGGRFKISSLTTTTRAKDDGKHTTTTSGLLGRSFVTSYDSERLFCFFFGPNLIWLFKGHVSHMLKCQLPSLKTKFLFSP